jgi:hypothetical protein
MPRRLEGEADERRAERTQLADEAKQVCLS